jgi:hypothetical protein
MTQLTRHCRFAANIVVLQNVCTYMVRPSLPSQGDCCALAAVDEKARLDRIILRFHKLSRWRP